jgi:hypothetical protein
VAAASIEVDTPADLERARAALASSPGPGLRDAQSAAGEQRPTTGGMGRRGS